jgi:hypothetical protein
MLAETYIKRAVKEVKQTLGEVGQRLKSKSVTPMTDGYRAEFYMSTQLDDVKTNYFQGLIGVLRWIVLMDALIEIDMSKTDKKIFNNWRMFFQVCNLSNLTDHTGKKLHPWFYQRQAVINFIPNSNINWPRQQQPSMTTFRIWVNTLRRIVQFANNGEITPHLGAWIANPLDSIKISSFIHDEKSNIAVWDYTNKNWKIHQHVETKWGNLHFDRINYTTKTDIQYEQYIPVEYSTTDRRFIMIGRDIAQIHIPQELVQELPSTDDVLKISYGSMDGIFH